VGADEAGGAVFAPVLHGTAHPNMGRFAWRASPSSTRPLASSSATGRGRSTVSSDEFRTRRAANDVRSNPRRFKIFHHPVVGTLELTFLALQPLGTELPIYSYLAEPGGHPRPLDAVALPHSVRTSSTGPTRPPGPQRSESPLACRVPSFRDNVVVVKMAVGDGSRRRYTMRARADAAEQTAERVMHAAITLWRAEPFEQITLQQIADEAGVSLSTVMRRFGSKDGLVEAVLLSDGVRTQAGRDAIAVGDVAAAVRMIVADYELNGDAVIRMLALEDRIDAVRRVVTAGRVAHERWVQRVFAPLLGPTGERRARTLQLVVATDVYTWKLLRRDRQLAAEEVGRVMEDLCLRVVGGGDR
jgi:AcrR family transcriptional regulator